MFLPVIMVDRWGWAGLLAFAVPNVIGCAAFGYVLRDRQRAARMVSEHRAAMRLFSIVTLAYHVFFIGFIAWALAPFEYWDGIHLAIAGPIALLAISALLSRLPRGAWLPFAAGVYVFSLGVFASLGVGPLTEIPATLGEMMAADRGLVWIVPALAFGFLLCPYLDLTFHRALASSPSRHSFAIFGAAFAVMILLTVAYADALSVGLSWIVLAHITAQSIFTMTAHQRELLDKSTSQQLNKSTSAAPLRDAGRGHALPVDRASTGRGTARFAVALAPVLALPLAFAGLFYERPLDGSIDMYLRFLVFYGLVFPAYVLLFMSRLAPVQPQRPRLLVFAAAAVVVAPLYELAFIHGLAALAVGPPVAILLWAIVIAARRPAT